jgi:uncharacterized protein (DUF1697 family)
MTRYVALLRGINVGGNNLIPMAKLKACFEKSGFENVSTYIASGNVLFESSEPAAKLEQRIEQILSSTFSYKASVVLRSKKQMKDVLVRAPKGFGDEPEGYRYDVLFLKSPLTSKTAIKNVATKPGVDSAYTGPGVLYFSRLVAKATQSQLNKIVGSPIYKSLTIRNWNTTTKLVALMERRD